MRAAGVDRHYIIIYQTNIVRYHGKVVPMTEANVCMTSAAR